MSLTARGGITVVVSTYDERRWPDLAVCLNSLAAQTAPPQETIVVADYNWELLERVRDSFPDVRAIPNTRSRGLAGARNTGIDHASGDLIAFLDDDARAEPHWLERLSKGLADSNAVGVGGALIPRWPGRRPQWLPAEFLWTIGCSYAGLPTEPEPVRNPIGASMAVRASVLRDVGGFREGVNGDRPRELRARGVVRAGGNVPDDTDLALRISRRLPDAIWRYEPRAIAHHTVTPERATFAYFLRRCYEEGVGKAGLARYAGHRSALSAERRHLAVVLPRAVARNLAGMFRGDPGGGLRATAILIGTLATAVGFLISTVAWSGSWRQK